MSPELPIQGDCTKENLLAENIKQIGDVTIIQNSSKHKHNVSIKTKNRIDSTFTKRLDLDHLN